MQLNSMSEYLETLLLLLLAYVSCAAFFNSEIFQTGPLCVATRPGLSQASSMIMGYNIPSNDMSKN